MTQAPDQKRIEEVEQLNASADYLKQNNILVGKITPNFYISGQGELGLSLDPINTKLAELSLEETSLEALNIKQEYMVDAENVIKRTQAYKK